MQVAVDVTNTGRREGKEVVQLYLKELVSNYSEDYGFMLKRFQKINLLPGINKYHTNRSGKKKQSDDYSLLFISRTNADCIL